MAKPHAKRFYNSKPWKDCRKSYISKRIAIDGGMCEHCDKELGYILDHIEEITPSNINDINIILSHDNLQYLCLPCHNIKTFGEDIEVIQDGLMFDSEGNIIKL